MRGGGVDLAAAVGQRSEIFQRQRVEAQCFGAVNAPAVLDLVEQLVESRVVNHWRSLAPRGVQTT